MYQLLAVYCARFDVLRVRDAQSAIANIFSAAVFIAIKWASTGFVLLATTSIVVQLLMNKL